MYIGRTGERYAAGAAATVAAATTDATDGDATSHSRQAETISTQKMYELFDFAAAAVVIAIAIAFYISFLAPVWSFLFTGSQ